MDAGERLMANQAQLKSKFYRFKTVLGQAMRWTA